MPAPRLPDALVLQTAVIVLVLLRAGLSSGGEWHTGSESACSDCHTMHNSANGQPMRYDGDSAPAPRLLRHATSLSLCTYCHDGSTPTAPDVVAPVTYVADPLGGLFPTNPGTVTGTGHALATVSPLLPPGGATEMILTCVSCHDPHGSPSYRNLKTDPLGTGQTALVATTQKVKANGRNPAQVYVAGNIVDKAGMSAWCGTCHGNFHGRTPGAEGTGSPWMRHPQDQALASSAHVDYGHWLSVIPNRVRVQSPNDDIVPSSDDQVFCLSCHKAHGSANRAALIFADGERAGSTCQQCHDQ